MKNSQLSTGRKILYFLVFIFVTIWQITAADFVNIKFHEGSERQLTPELESQILNLGPLFTLPEWRLAVPAPLIRFLLLQA